MSVPGGGGGGVPGKEKKNFDLGLVCTFTT